MRHRGMTWCISMGILKPLGLGALALIVIGLVLLVVGVSTTSWIILDNQGGTLGLFQMCKEFFGDMTCKSISFQDNREGRRNERELLATRGLVISGLICSALGLLVAVAKTVSDWKATPPINKIPYWVACGLNCLAGFAIASGVGVFGSSFYPTYDNTDLGYSFILAAFSAGIIIVGGALLVIGVEEGRPVQNLSDVRGHQNPVAYTVTSGSESGRLPPGFMSRSSRSTLKYAESLEGEKYQRPSSSSSKQSLSLTGSGKLPPNVEEHRQRRGTGRYKESRRHHEGSCATLVSPDKSLNRSEYERPSSRDGRSYREDKSYRSSSPNNSYRKEKSHRLSSLDRASNHKERVYRTASPDEIYRRDNSHRSTSPNDPHRKDTEYRLRSMDSKSQIDVSDMSSSSNLNSSHIYESYSQNDTSREESHQPREKNYSKQRHFRSRSPRQSQRREQHYKSSSTDGGLRDKAYWMESSSGMFRNESGYVSTSYNDIDLKGKSSRFAGRGNKEKSCASMSSDNSYRKETTF